MDLACVGAVVGVGVCVGGVVWLLLCSRNLTESRSHATRPKNITKKGFKHQMDTAALGFKLKPET